MHRDDRRSAWWIVGLALLAGALAPASAMDAALVARIGEPFVLNGKVYAGGCVGVREVTDMSPATTLHEVRLDGQSIGVVLSRESDQVAPASRDELVFTRGRDGLLVFSGLALRGERARDLVSQPEPPPAPLTTAQAPFASARTSLR